jgi:hypothetical protein
MIGGATRRCGKSVPAPDGPSGRATRLPLRARSGVLEQGQGHHRKEAQKEEGFQWFWTKPRRQGASLTWFVLVMGDVITNHLLCFHA